MAGRAVSRRDVLTWTGIGLGSLVLGGCGVETSEASEGATDALMDSRVMRSSVPTSSSPTARRRR
ncbi:hypothetical protein AKJ09_04843 [Labilithrix luteola]|uniref:Uncharacterized protein n=1 Tax=Labilithrix luteola TaxID=1391654 RepID=A0A0K1PYF9_9BACT|nr:hypothetical protein AKJ09_04843 [Labilithrix luteola]